MSDELILDALNPPDPDSLVADLKSVGAVAIGAYVLRRDGAGNNVGIGAWTAAHVAACLAVGIGVFGIIVPGNVPLDTDPQTAMSVAATLGIPVGVMAIDIETFSEPRSGWVTGAIAEFNRNNWFVIRYGDVSVLSSYTHANGDWISHGYIPVRDNQLFPMPGLPNVAGVIGDQYTVGVNINGHSYDGSVFDSSVISRMGENVDMGLTAQQDQALARLLTGFADGEQSTTYDGQTPIPANSPNFIPDVLNAIMTQLTSLEQQVTVLQAAVDKLTPSGTPTLVQHIHPGGQTGPAVAS